MVTEPTKPSTKGWRRIHPWSDYRYPLALCACLVMLTVGVYAVLTTVVNVELRHQLNTQSDRSTCRNEKNAATSVATAQVLAQLVLAVTTPPAQPYDATKLRALAVTMSNAAEAQRVSVLTCLTDPKASTVVSSPGSIGTVTTDDDTTTTAG